MSQPVRSEPVCVHEQVQLRDRRVEGGNAQPQLLGDITELLYQCPTEFQLRTNRKFMLDPVVSVF